MNQSRRSFLRAAALAPAVILTPGLLMPVRPLASGDRFLGGTWCIGELSVYDLVTPAKPLFPGEPHQLGDGLTGHLSNDPRLSQETADRVLADVDVVLKEFWGKYSLQPKVFYLGGVRYEA